MTDLSERMLELFEISYGPVHPDAWGVRLRRRFGYFTPDERYEEVLERLIDDKTVWLDVGGGSNIFPGNPTLSRILADRCDHLTVVDPSSNIETNPYTDHRIQGMLEDISDTAVFTLATARMVAEHVVNPMDFVGKLGKVMVPGGKVVIYTVGRWSPVTVLSGMTPISVHHWAKRILWKTREEDTFPVCYLMNTRSRLTALFEKAGFRCNEFHRLDDCRTLGRWKPAVTGELIARSALNAIGLGYPEACLLGVFEKL